MSTYARPELGELSDVFLAERIADEYHAANEWAAVNRSEWRRYDGRRWRLVTAADAEGYVRMCLKSIHGQEVSWAEAARDEALAAAAKIPDPKERSQREAAIANDHYRRVKGLTSLLTVGKVTGVTRLLRGYLMRDADVFDREHTLLNVGNGVVDLTTGELLPHSPKYLFTRVTEAEYHPRETYAEDVVKALDALPGHAVRNYLQVRIGQAASGYATPDDVVPFLMGAGKNGKSTVLAGVQRALGEFAEVVSPKVIMGSPGDHPTELMPLQGLRVALLEELPEGDYLNVDLLKRIVGTPRITARRIGQDNVSWTPTHTLLITTNYETKVNASDYGSERRLQRIPFPYTYDAVRGDRVPDPDLRSRITHGENAPDEWLHWIVEGAVTFFQEGYPEVPEEVETATREWLTGANKPLAFVNDALVLAPGHVTPSAEVYAEYREWCETEGTKPLSAETFWQRAQAHQWFRNGDAVKPRNPFRVRADETFDGPRPSGVVRGVRGVRLASKVTPAQARAAEGEAAGDLAEEGGAVRLFPVH